MCILCSFHSKWQAHERSEWKHMVPHKAVAQNWHAVTRTHIPLAKASHGQGQSQQNGEVKRNTQFQINSELYHSCANCEVLELYEVSQGSNSLKNATYFHDSLGTCLSKHLWTKVSTVEGGQKEEELGHWDAVKASGSNRDTTISHETLGLMDQSDTCSVLSTWPGPRDFWERLREAAFSTNTSVSLSFSLLWISTLCP